MHKGSITLGRCTLLALTLCAFEAQAQEEADESQVVRIYGFIDSYFEKVAQTPASIDANGDTVYEDNPYEFDVPNLHLMVQGVIGGKYRYFLNLAAPGSGGIGGDEGLAVRNAWVEAPIAGNALQVRWGKTYRRFGLYNEILDAVPTFIGIEAPELLDKDHLIVTRTTNLMVHGSIPFGDNAVQYALMTGNDERTDGAFPLGGDLRFKIGSGIQFGTSVYSSGGKASPTRGVGDGSPRGGVLNWMTEDEYLVFGGYAELKQDGLILQAAFWQASHEGTRDPSSVLSLIDAGLNERQLARFGLNGPNPTEADVVTEANYDIITYYVRAGYAMETSVGEFTPYLQWDHYENPETIASKSFGGDGEAGLTDDGAFDKATIGTIWRPISPVALKLDGSAHIQDFNGKQEIYPEVRLSFSYFWQLEEL
ncbi:MAG: hypothetical protein ACE366_22130 [Bradymonadia bacterium]